jgi:hypothetical protein
MADLTPEAKLLEDWKSLVEKRGRKNTVQVLIEQAESQMKDREKFIAEATDEKTLLGNKVELARLTAERDNLEVEDRILDIEITGLKVKLAKADTSALNDIVQTSIKEDASDAEKE